MIGNIPCTGWNRLETEITPETAPKLKPEEVVSANAT